jgi:hypothetical protein
VTTTLQRPDTRPHPSGWGWVVGVALADRRSATRLLTMALGVALCTLVLWALASIDPTVARTMSRAELLQPVTTGGPPTFRYQQSTVSDGGVEVDGYLVAAVVDHPAPPPGVPTFPAGGQLWVSPALAALLTQDSQNSLLAQQLGPVTGVFPADVLPDPDQLMFFRGIDALPQSMTGVTGDADGWGVPQLSNSLDATTWLVLITGVTILMVPLLLFTALAARIGAERRDRRSALLRLLGASVRQVRVLVTAEALIAVVVGEIIAVALSFALRAIASTVTVGGHRLRMADIGPDLGPAVAVLVGTAALGVVASLVGSRTAEVGPTGVLSRPEGGGRLWWRWVLLGVAAVGITVILETVPNYSWTSDVWRPCAVIVLMLFTIAAWVGPLTVLVARRLRGGDPAMAMAAGRITADGPAATRAAAALATVLAGVLALFNVLNNPIAGGDFSSSEWPTTNVSANVQEVDSAELTRVVDSLAALDPGGSVQTSIGLSAVLPDGSTSDTRITIVPCAFLITGVPCADGDVFSSEGVDESAPLTVQFADGTATWTPPAHPVRVDIASWTWFLTPAAAAPLLAGHRFDAFLNFSVPTDDMSAAIRATAWLGWRGYALSAAVRFQDPSTFTARYPGSTQLPWIRAGLITGSVLTLLIAALGMWLISADQLRERRRALSLARAAGVPLRTLARSVFLASLLPVVVGVVVAELGGGALTALLSVFAPGSQVAFDPGIALLGAAVALAVTAAVAGGSVLRLRRTTAGTGYLQG